MKLLMPARLKVVVLNNTQIGEAGTFFVASNRQFSVLSYQQKAKQLT